MGLDMYLRAKLSVYYLANKAKSWEEIDAQRKEISAGVVKALGVEGLDMEVKSVEFEVGYWRKANAIHQWFVQNCQDGVDKCQESYVSTEDIIKLRDICKRVLTEATTEKSKVSAGYTIGPKGEQIHDYVDGVAISNPEVLADLLPTQEGFFFGCTDYDGGYIEDVKHTLEIIDKYLAIPEESRNNMSLYYRSSW
jgi:hypothetical protein